MSKLQQAMQHVEAYFQSTYRGKADNIHALFHSTATISGLIDGMFYAWSVQGFVDKITQGQSAVDLNEVYDKQILDVQLNGDIAYVKARNLVGDIYFTDQINLIWQEEQWLIINKVFMN